MFRKILCLFLTLILTGVTLFYDNSVFFGTVLAEEQQMISDEVIDTTDEAVSYEDIETTEQSLDADDRKNAEEIPNTAEEIEKKPDPEPVRSTKLITNPYKGYSYKRLISEINKLQKQYPDLVKKEYIGKTAGGRKIPLVKVGNGKRKVLIIGSEHAREYVTTSLIMRSIDTYSRAYVLKKKIDGTNVRKVLDRVTFYFVPMLNIDGVQLVLGTTTSKDKSTVKKYVGTRHYSKYKNMWKSNLRGVDINRNYPFRWSRGDSVRHRAFMNFKGRKQASEPETKSVVKLCRNNQFAFMFTMHTKGQIIYWKDKYNDVVPGASSLAKKVKSITKYRLMSTSGWASCAGESAKWFRAVYNKPAFTIELTPVSLSYKKATKNFDKYVWKKNKSLFLKTALATAPTDKYKVFFNAGKGRVGKRYINIKTGKAYGTLPKAKRKGCRFIGWYTSKGKKITKKSIAAQTKNTVLYAKYKKK